MELFVSDGSRAAASSDVWASRLIELSSDEVVEDPPVEDAGPAATEPCVQVADCMVNCTLPDLKAVILKSAEYNCQVSSR